MLIMGAVMRPQEKNWRKTATTAWQMEGFLMLQAVILQSVLADCVLLLNSIVLKSFLACC